MADVDTLSEIAVAEPEFRLSDYLDLSRPVDYYILRKAHIAACEAFCGPQFRAAVCALGEREAAFWERTIAANYTRIVAGDQKAPAGYLADAPTPVKEQPTKASPFWWQR